jgi:hypothetical protein
MESLAEKGGPTLTVPWRAAGLAHVPLGGSLGDCDAELEELAARALGAPEPILEGHAADEANDLGWNAERGRRLLPGSPRPEQAEACAMPPKEGVRRDDEQGIAPAREHGGKGDEKDTVPRTELGPLHSASSDGKLMTEKCALGAKCLGGANEIRKESPRDAGGPARRGREARQGNSGDGGASAFP